MQQHEFIEAFRQIRPVITPLTAPFCNTNQQAAVLIPVVIRPKLTLLFTKRAHHLRHHPGQICFPGGKHDTRDHSMKSTAIRECCEEVNMQPDNINIIGSLPSVHASSGFTVHPIIGLIVPPQQWEYNKQEVDEVFEVPVSHFLQQKHYQLFQLLLLICLRRFIVLMADMALLSPSLPFRPPHLSKACSTLWVVRTPNITGI